MRDHLHEAVFFWPGAQGLNLLPVELKKLWSDQLTGVEANFLSYVTPNQPASGLGTGRRDKTYIFMGAAQSNNFDLKGHLKAKVSVPGPPELRNKILWRLAKKNGNSYTPENGSSSYDSAGEIVTITLDSPSADKSHYVLVAGYDQDDNGQLSASEANFIPKYSWKGAEYDYEIKLVSRDRYDSGTSWLNTTANLWILFPRAKSCLRAFLDKSTPDGASAENTTIDRLEYGLDHPVGIIFKANSSSVGGLPHAGPGDSITAVFGAQSNMSRDVADSTTIHNWLHEKLDGKAAEVRAYFTSHPDENYATFNFNFDTKNGQGEEEGLIFYPDTDLFLAIGKGTLDANIQIEVNRGLQVQDLIISANVFDLYDFDYDAKEDGSSPEEVEWAADVQAGYNTLGEGGRVYKSRIEIRDYQISGASFGYQFP